MTTFNDTGVPSDLGLVDKRIGFYVTPDFSPVGLFCAVEVLRTANRFMNTYSYGWEVCSPVGGMVASVNGIPIMTTNSADAHSRADKMIICSGFNPEEHCDANTLSWVRNLSRRGKQIGAISTGTYILAAAGVIGGRNCTIHIDNAASLRENFPTINLLDSVFEVDRGLLTCAGGTSAIDMMIHMVSTEHGEKFASDLAHQFQQDRVRNSQDYQSKFKNAVINAKAPRLARAIEFMSDNLDLPLQVNELADKIGISPRQLQRQFRKHTGRGPKEFYLNLRLHHGRLLLLQTQMPVVDVAVASGFLSHAHFTKLYRQEFGYPPKLERQHAF